jgi:hypothetical protein
MKLTEKTRANILHFLYLNCIDIPAHPHATAYGILNRKFVSFRVNHGKVILPAFGKRSRNICGFKAVCQHLSVLSRKRAEIGRGDNLEFICNSRRCADDDLSHAGSFIQ